MMNHRERTMAVLNEQPYDKLPIVDFGFNQKLLQTWARQGHFDKSLLNDAFDAGSGQLKIEQMLGFDFNWQGCLMPLPDTGIYPPFDQKVLETFANGTKKVISRDGAIQIIKDGLGTIPSDVGTMLEDRQAWQKHYVHRLQYCDDRIPTLDSPTDRSTPRGLHCGSLYGQIRNWLGVQGISYLYADDEELYDEVIETNGQLCYDVTVEMLKKDISYDFAHFWEDICFKNGPLVNPEVFREKVGPQYRRITQLLAEHNINLVSLDCDGMIDHLLPIWLENGVNVMFPIEVGTWHASIKPWREKYGRSVKGVGGMDKRVFSMEYSDIDREIERLRPLVELGGYIPCPDHRMPPDAKWENVQYYCDKMRQIFH